MKINQTSKHKVFWNVYNTYVVILVCYSQSQRNAYIQCLLEVRIQVHISLPFPCQCLRTYLKQYASCLCIQRSVIDNIEEQHISISVGTHDCKLFLDIILRPRFISGDVLYLNTRYNYVLVFWNM